MEASKLLINVHDVIAPGESDLSDLGVTEMETAGVWTFEPSKFQFPSFDELNPEQQWLYLWKYSALMPRKEKKAFRKFLLRFIENP